VTKASNAVRAHRDRRLAQLAKGRTPVFGTIASLGPLYKGIQFALPAFAELARAGKRFEYRILGPGDPAPWLKMISDLGLESCCHLDGVRHPGEPVLEWLDGIDVHLQPSLTESLSRSTIEAMSRGVACLASSAGGLPEYLSPEQLHQPGNVADLTAHIGALLDDPAAIAQLSDFSFERVERFNRESIERRRGYLYQRLAEMCRRSA
jgi:glycosyltransferase involved in cell wall biosynthesis